ncbi:MAG: hypothetical protein DRO88_03660 [Promethearchaeia archaeon]|nr:MAG: hypothetical protein DRO88_03660 [Candidatus Lokiarchaeia archaeon]
MGSKQQLSYRKTGEIGIVSGSERLDPSQFSEQDLDDSKNMEEYFENQLQSLEFRTEMEEKLEQWNHQLLPEALSHFDFFMVGQSHIDMAWLWRYEQTRQKGITTLKKVLAHAKKFPHQFVFAVSSPQLLSWIKEDDPELFSSLLSIHKKEQLELVGGSWVEPDCMLPSGESIVRQRLYGMKFYQEEFGILPEVEWFLDSFGYNKGLPQILAKSGAKYFWTTKLTWNKQNKFPFIYFIWESPDGTQLITANFAQNREIFDQWKDYPFGHYTIKDTNQNKWNYQDDFSRIAAIINRNKIIRPVGLFWGAGDGGHGPAYYEVAQMQVLSELAKSQGIQWNWSMVHNFFSEIEKYQNNLAVWNDELYLEAHRGTFTVHSAVKRHNRRLENRILDIERLATLCSLMNPNYEFPSYLFDRSWKTLLLNQFHDVLPGSCVPEVLDDVFKLFSQVDKNLDEILSQLLNYFPHNVPSEFKTKNLIFFFNPLNWRRKSRVFIPKCLIREFKSSTNTESNLLPYARLYYNYNGKLRSSICQPVKAEFQDNMNNHKEGWWTIIEMDPHGAIIGEIRFESVQSPPLFISLRKTPRITNGKVSLEFDPHMGSLISVKGRKINKGENLIYGKRNFILEGYKDKGSSEYPAWDIQKEYWKYPLNFNQRQDLEISIVDQGPIFSTLKIQRTLENSKVIQKISLFHDDPLIYCSWAANWQLPDTLLKLGLFTNTQATSVTSDQMYCASSSSTLPETPADIARFEKVMHKYVDISTPDNKWGIAIINEGKYAYDASGGRIRISMHRSPKYPRPSAESWVKFERLQRKNEGKGKPLRYSGIGPTSCRFAILPHVGGCLVNEKQAPSTFVPKMAEEFNHPIVIYSFNSFKLKSEPEKSDNLPDIHSFSFDLQTGIELSVIKPEQWNKDNSVILRFIERCGFTHKKSIIQFPKDFASLIEEIWETDLLERPKIPLDLKWSSDTTELILDFSPFEIRTIKCKLKKSR